MKKLTSICSAFFFVMILYSQGYKIDWQILIGGSDKDVAHAIAKTLDNGYIIAGSTKSNDGDLNNNIQNGNTDLWIIKLNSNGFMEWSKTFGGSSVDVPNAIISTSDRGYLTVGFTESDDGDISGFHGQRDGWVLKLDENGIIEWQKSLGGSGSETLSDVLELNDGYLISGQDGSFDGDLEEMNCQGDFWLIKLDFQGEIIWQKCYGGSGDDFPNKMVRAFDDKTYIVGHTNSDDGDVSMLKGDYDFWVIGIDNIEGDLLWEKTLGGSKRDVAKDIIFNGLVNFLYIIGETDSSDGDILSNHGGTDIWFAVLEGWNKSILTEFSMGGSEDETVNKLAFYDFVNVFVAGSSASSDGDVTEGHGDDDMWIIKMAPKINGVDLLWNKCFGGSGFEQATDFELSFSKDGEYSFPDGVVVTGYTNSTDGDVRGLHGDYDIWVVNLTSSTSAVQDILLNPKQIIIYPNPASRELHVDFANNNLYNNIVKLFDTSGKLIFSQELSSQVNNHIIKIPEIPDGMYWCLIVVNDKYMIYKKLNIINLGL